MQVGKSLSEINNNRQNSISLRRSIKKQILYRILYDNQNYESAAETVGVDLNTVKKILVRHNLKKLRKNTKINAICQFKILDKDEESPVQILYDTY